MTQESAHLREQAKLEALVAATATELGALAAKADKKIAARIKRFLAELKAAGKSDAARAAAADRLERDLLRLHVSSFGKDSAFAKAYRKQIVQAAKAGKQRFAANAAEATGRQVLSATARRDVASILISARDSFKLVEQNLTADAVSEVRRLVTESLLKGDGQEALARRLMKSGHIPDLEKSGRTLRAETRAQMIARTEPRRIAAKAYRDSFAQVEPDPKKRLFKWVSVLAPNSGEDSLIRHGIILNEEEWETHDFGDGLYGLPPIRPNDQCSEIAIKESWLSDSARDALAESDADVPRLVTGGEERERTRLLND